MIKKRLGLFVLACVVGAAHLSLFAVAAPPAADAPEAAADHRVPLGVARDRAKLMHDVFAETLDVVHMRYFRRDGPVLPSRALEDVFSRLEQSSGVKLRWISVNTPAMTVGHEPKTEFEKKAAVELSAGKEEYSRVEGGYLYRAGPIPLGSRCVGCHTKPGVREDKKPRFAGLVVAVPVKGD